MGVVTDIVKFDGMSSVGGCGSEWGGASGEWMGEMTVELHKLMKDKELLLSELASSSLPLAPVPPSLV
jgi:hypothetical protein